MKLLDDFAAFVFNENGSVALEYALVAAILGVGGIVVLSNFRLALAKLYAAIIQKLAA